MPSKLRVVVTGASGVLGTAIYAAFKAAGYTVLGLANSRAAGELQKVDLLDSEQIDATLKDFHADWVVHCAAERRPDVAEQNPELARNLNTDVPEHLAQLSRVLRFRLIYISTDYVFDGTSPPYTTASPTNPLNFYGRTKRDGELAVLGVVGSRTVVLRVPVLYGPAPNNSDSAVNTLLDVVSDQSGKTYKMDHWATRYPTNVLDIADFLVRLAALPPIRQIPPIVHYSAEEPFTKYEMCLVFARILGLPHAHIIPDAEPPKGDAATARPQNCQLYLQETDDLMDGEYGGLGWQPFEEWWEAHLSTRQ